ncbi:hypothetical protein BHM03_00062589 [Ensete ventricosum]|nr:hypothetical protein BHM03_00062589 [Ensete ventricosum]
MVLFACDNSATRNSRGREETGGGERGESFLFLFRFVVVFSYFPCFTVCRIRLRRGDEVGGIDGRDRVREEHGLQTLQI